MKRKKPAKRTPEEKAHSAEIQRRLKERLEYYEARIRERDAREAS